MLFYVLENGKRVAYQSVKRNNKIYFRKAPRTLLYPTKGQMQVRYYLMLGSHEAALKNMNREELLENVRKMPYHLNPYKKKNITTTDIIKDKYPEIIQYQEAIENASKENFYSRGQERSIKRVSTER